MIMYIYIYIYVFISATLSSWTLCVNYYLRKSPIMQRNDVLCGKSLYNKECLCIIKGFPYKIIHTLSLSLSLSLIFLVPSRRLHSAGGSEVQR